MQAVEHDTNPGSAWKDTGPPSRTRRKVRDLQTFEEHTQWAIQLLEIVREFDASGKLHSELQIVNNNL